MILTALRSHVSIPDCQGVVTEIPTFEFYDEKNALVQVKDCFKFILLETCNCKDCKHWERVPGENNGQCDTLREKAIEEDVDVPALFTYVDFGCKFFEQEEEK